VEPDIEPPQADDMPEHLVEVRVQRPPAVLGMPESQGAVAFAPDVPDLDVGFVAASIVLLGKRRTGLAVTGVVVDCGDLQLAPAIVVEPAEEFHSPHQSR